MNSSFLFAQNRTIDSLLAVLKKDKSDTNKVSHLNNLAWELSSRNPDTAILISNEARVLAEELKWKKGMANTIGNLGTYYWLKSNNTKALFYYFKALTIGESILNDANNLYEKQTAKKIFARYFGNIGIVYDDQDNYPKALEYYTKALKIGHELRDKERIAIQLSNIGIIYRKKSDYLKALKYFFKAWKLAKEIGNKNGIVANLANIGNVYQVLSDNIKALDYSFKALKLAEELGNKRVIASQLGNIGIIYQNLPDQTKALQYHFIALKLAEELGNKNGIAITLGNIGTVYGELANNTKNSDTSNFLRIKALDYFFKTLKIRKELGAKNLIATTIGNIGSIYISIGEFKEAEENLKQALAIDTTIGFKLHEKDIYESFSHLYDTLAILKERGFYLSGFGSTSELYKKALVHYKKATILKDTIFNEEKSKDIGRLEQKHEFEMAELKRKQEEKAKAVTVAVAVSRRNKLEYSAILLGIFALFVIVFFIVRFNLPHWVVELAVFIPFLILFEFMLVLLDPYLEQMTGGEPVWKLLVNSLLAAMIFPIHGFFERMLKKRISKSEKVEMESLSS